MSEEKKVTNVDEWFSSINIGVRKIDNIDEKQREFIEKLGNEKGKFEYNIDNLKKVLDNASSVPNELSDQADFLDGWLAAEILKCFRKNNNNIKFDGIGDYIFSKFKSKMNVGYLFSFFQQIREVGGTLSLTLDAVLEKSKGGEAKHALYLLKECQAMEIDKGNVTIGAALGTKFITGEVNSDDYECMLDVLDWLPPTNNDDVEAVLSVLPADECSMDNMLKLVDKLKNYLEKGNAKSIISKLSDRSPDNMIKIVEKIKGLNIIDKNVCEHIFNITRIKTKGKEIDVDNMLKLLTELEKYGFKFDKDHLEKLLKEIEGREQNAREMLKLVKFLSSRKMLTEDMFKNIFKKNISSEAPAIDVANLLIEAGSAFNWDRVGIGTDEILDKVAQNQSEADVLQLAKAAMMIKKSVSMYTNKFRDKIDKNKRDIKAGQDLETLLNLRPNTIEYKTERNKLIKEFQDKKSSNEKKNNNEHIVSVHTKKTNEIDEKKIIDKKEKIITGEKEKIGEKKEIIIDEKEKIDEKKEIDGKIITGEIDGDKDMITDKKEKIDEKEKIDGKKEIDGKIIIDEIDGDKDMIIKAENTNVINPDGLKFAVNLIKLLKKESMPEGQGPEGQGYDDEKREIANRYSSFSKKGKFAVEEKDKVLFAKCILNQLTLRLNFLSEKYKSKNKSWSDFEDQLEDEKSYLKDVNKELAKVGLLDDMKAKEANKKIDDIYDVNGFITFLQWLGCTLSVPFSLGLSLRFKRIKNRVCFHTKCSRIFERLQERKDKYWAPLQESMNKENNKDDLSKH